MCVDNLEDWKTSNRDITVYKICRVDRSGQFRSRFSVSIRLPQEKGYDSRSQGTDEIYHVGERKRSSRIGYYCYSSMRVASRHSHPGEAILKCIVPAGKKYRKQIDGKAILAKVIIPESIITKGKR